MRKAAIVLVVIAALAFGIVGCSKSPTGLPSAVATVNGKPISSESYIQDLSGRYGQQSLRTLVEQEIVLQWADDEKAAPTAEQLKAQEDLLKRQGQYEDQLKQFGEAGIKQQLKLQQAVINLAKKSYKFTEADYKKAYNDGKPLFVHGARKQVVVILEPTQDKIDADVKKLKSGTSWETVAATAVQLSADGPLKAWIQDDGPSMLPPNMVAAAKATKVGEVSKVIPLTAKAGPSQYAVVVVLKEVPKENRSYEQSKTEAEDLAAIQKVRSDPDFQKKLDDKRKAAKIEINLPEFKAVAGIVNNPPARTPMPQAPQPQPSPAPGN